MWVSMLLWFNSGELYPLVLKKSYFMVSTCDTVKRKNAYKDKIFDFLGDILLHLTFNAIHYGLSFLV